MKARHFLLEDLLPLKLLGRIYGREGHRPAAIQLSAAVMFIDVSRYTALVEQLARRGQEGLEDLPRLLSSLFVRPLLSGACHTISEAKCSTATLEICCWLIGPPTPTDLDPPYDRRLPAQEIICRSGNDGKHRSVSEISPALHIGIAARGSPLDRRFGRTSDMEPDRRWRSRYPGRGVEQAIARSWNYVTSYLKLNKHWRVRGRGDASFFSQRDFRNSVQKSLPSTGWLSSLPMQVRELLSTDLRPPAGSRTIGDRRGPLPRDRCPTGCS